MAQSETECRMKNCSFNSSNDHSTSNALETMSSINMMVKSNQLSSVLAAQIFGLYQFLKKHGESLEISHKDELNQVFVSFRQACSRDAGQLGTPCRLKMMELVELRAMKWRPNLAHSQYYAQRTANCLKYDSKTQQLQQQQQQQHNNQSVQNGRPNSFSSPIFIPPVTITTSVNNIPSLGSRMSSASLTTTQPSPTTITPTTALATSIVTPYTGIFPTQQANTTPSLLTPADMINAHIQRSASFSPGTAPAFYLLPSSTAQGTTVMPQFMPGLVPATAATNPVIAAALATQRVAAANLLAAAAAQQNRFGITATNPTVLINPLVATPTSLAASGTSDFCGSIGDLVTRQCKLAGKGQCREDVVIRNSDSGKIMGVKGRRITLIEEMSGTIVSFQKVPQTAVERTLTITGPDDESILRAKLLIEDTIRRNVSPDRMINETVDVQNFSNPSVDNLRGLAKDSLNLNPNLISHENLTKNLQSIERTTNHGQMELDLPEIGGLKLSCSDPQVLKAAKQALNEYFGHLHGGVQVRRCSLNNVDFHRGLHSSGGVGPTFHQHKSTSAKIINRERRKSMPGGPFVLEKLIEDGNENGQPSLLNSPVEKFPGNITQLTTSIPNLSKPFVEQPSSNSIITLPSLTNNITKIVYTRDFMLQCSKDTALNMMPNFTKNFLTELGDSIFKDGPQFDPIIYKCVHSAFKQHYRF